MDAQANPSNTRPVARPAPASVFYQFKEVVEEEGITHYLTPWGNPKVYETPFDFMFNSPEEARQALVEWGVDEEESAHWVLMKVTEEAVNDEGFRAEAIEKLKGLIRCDAENMQSNDDLIDSYLTLYLKVSGIESMTDAELADELAWRTDDDEE